MQGRNFECKDQEKKKSKRIKLPITRQGWDELSPSSMDHSVIRWSISKDGKG
jgi:hypothetical protein